MDEHRLRTLLDEVAGGQVDVDAALGRLRNLPFEDLGYAKVDHHRALRQGFPEVVFCQGKTCEQVEGIMAALCGHADVVLATRAGRDMYDRVQARLPEAVYHEAARIIQIGAPATQTEHIALVMSAGTADIPVAEEAAVTAAAAGATVQRLYDVGVSGIHRLLAHQELLNSAAVLVVVAGMEGALASVVGGLVNKPVVGVPTSVGYGASFGGLATLLTMLNSCASGVVVVNIDNGFGAGYFAAMLCKQLG
jgi:pyridinium-3,5-biscarboxylic acid mononucleotide synthase